jgi:hypothetical protein
MSSKVKRQMLTDNKTAHVAVRIQPEVLKRLRRAAKSGDYPLTVSQIIYRGIELALRELERKEQRGS